MESRKEMKARYKEMKFRMGVFSIKNQVNQKIFIGSSTDLDAIWNRIRTELRFGNYPNHILQEDWNSFGQENFTFEILSELKHEEDKDSRIYRKEAKDLEKMYIEELQPFGDKGYNVKAG